MKALVFTAAGVVEYLDRPEPVLKEGETLVTVRSSAICGSELHGFRSLGFRMPPLIMGHEFAGVASDGRRVVVNPLLSCGECGYCAGGQPQLCAERQLIGVNRDGGFAEHVAVPSTALRSLPEEVSWLDAALIEPLANAVHAVSLAGEAAGRVGVIGAGPIGLVCGLVARALGSDVTVTDVSAERRATAAALGLVAAERLDGDFDAVIDAVGVPASRHSAVAACRPGGTAVWVGLAVDNVELSGNAIVRGEKKVVGSFAYSCAEFDRAIELATRLDLSWSTAIPLSRSQEVFYALAAGDRSMVKAVIVPDGEAAA